MADAKLPVHDSQVFRNILRWTFRCNSVLTGEQAKQAQIQAVAALRVINTVYGKEIDELEKKRKQNSDLKGIRFSIGQVIRHKTDRYRGVVFGWDRVCKHPQFLTNPTVDFVQPFYSIIPDENDCIRSFGGPRMFQYVAQEDLESVQEPYKVTNGTIISHFDFYNPQLGKYIPKPQLKYEYPGEYGDSQEVEKIGLVNEVLVANSAAVHNLKAPFNKVFNEPQSQDWDSAIEEDGSVSDSSENLELPKNTPKVEGSDKAL